MTYLLIGLFFCLSISLVISLGLRAVYIVVVAAFVQNFVLPFLLTTGAINVAIASGCLYFKDVLCAVVLLYAVRSMYVRRTPLRLSFIVLGAFTAWCVLRGVGGILLGDDLFMSGRWLRDICAPLEFVIIGMALAEERFVAIAVRRYIVLVSCIGVIALALAGPWGKVVWGKYINIASYNELVKHESAVEQDEAEGVNGSGNLSDRAAFASIADYRAMGTFGEPLSMAFNMAFGLLLGVFVVDNKRWLALGVLALALFFSFTRSAWIFLVVSGMFVLFRRRKIWWIVALMIAVAVSVCAITPLREFAISTIGDFQGNAHPHAVGIRSFYTDIWSQPGILFGNGVDNAKLIESGYGNLVEIFGVPAYILLMLFYAAAIVDLAAESAISAVLQGTILATGIVMHFSYYPFAFNPYVVIWLAFGAAIAGGQFGTSNQSGSASGRDSLASGASLGHLEEMYLRADARG